MSLPFRLPLLLRVRLVGEFDIADVGGATSLVAQEIRFGEAGELTVTKLETNCIVSLCPDGSRFLWEYDDTLVNHDIEGMSAESSEYVMVTANGEGKSGLSAVVFDVGNGAVKLWILCTGIPELEVLISALETPAVVASAVSVGPE